MPALICCCDLQKEKESNFNILLNGQKSDQIFIFELIDNHASFEKITETGQNKYIVIEQKNIKIE